MRFDEVVDFDLPGGVFGFPVGGSAVVPPYCVIDDAVDAFDAAVVVGEEIVGEIEEDFLVLGGALEGGSGVDAEEVLGDVEEADEVHAFSLARGEHAFEDVIEGVIGVAFVERVNAGQKGDDKGELGKAFGGPNAVGIDGGGEGAEDGVEIFLFQEETHHDVGGPGQIGRDFLSGFHQMEDEFSEMFEAGGVGVEVVKESEIGVQDAAGYEIEEFRDGVVLDPCVASAVLGFVEVDGV